MLRLAERVGDGPRAPGSDLSIEGDAADDCDTIVIDGADGRWADDRRRRKPKPSFAAQFVCRAPAAVGDAIGVLCDRV